MPSISFVEAVLSAAEKDSSKLLGLAFGEQRITTPGQYLPRSDAQKEPQISFNVSSGTYIVISLDIDAPFPSLGFLGPILHWIHPGFKPSTDTTVTGETILTTSAPLLRTILALRLHQAARRTDMFFCCTSSRKALISRSMPQRMESPLVTGRG
ncbi:hypothetical protein HCH54_006897 [Aspergillus fumigatus]